MSETLPYPDVETTADSKRFWEELAHGRITLPWCNTCDTYVWFPRPLCPRCLTVVNAERTLAGEGDVYSFSIVHRAAPGFTVDRPYVFAYITLDDGPTVLSNVVGDDALDVSIGDRVRLVAPPQPVKSGALRFVRVGAAKH
ncbi:Zn-ribbon domain-containing OB-fold protein [Georgenia yuyongxinii]|uniref:Zn-ribbon domain-containing OB-fold protein n=1 Tax=Georgenia yuyongxinii TaxID=2589797 RepID=A0A552WVA8_9MICO|nr:OB-fold domain-containing protein [Georgenia yuyongxinii]TRW46687.1 hypothetical protein FJ693_04120 [Georgenia yuyongxinii]